MAQIKKEASGIEKELLVNEHAATYLKAVLVFDPDSRKWVRSEQPLTEDQFSRVVNAGILEMLSQILTELQVQTHYLKQGLNVNDEPEALRNELSTIS